MRRPARPRRARRRLRNGRRERPTLLEGEELVGHLMGGGRVRANGARQEHVRHRRNAVIPGRGVARAPPRVLDGPWRHRVQPAAGWRRHAHRLPSRLAARVRRAPVAHRLRRHHGQDERFPRVHAARVQVRGHAHQQAGGGRAVQHLRRAALRRQRIRLRPVQDGSDPQGRLVRRLPDGDGRVRQVLRPRRRRQLDRRGRAQVRHARMGRTDARRAPRRGRALARRPTAEQPCWRGRGAARRRHARGDGSRGPVDGRRRCCQGTACCAVIAAPGARGLA
mmetsp:Transcript_19312/g.60162  ORF Transcript_19312/g.60162 Transcript_19312/m.60162 type:complete len:279 (-) Transcript_19312:108-944(-)